MHRRVFLSMAGAFALAGCGGSRQSRSNPSNTPPADGSNPLIPAREDSIFRRAPREEVYEGTPVDQITALSIERTFDGAIIHVTGQTVRQGAFDVRLIPEQDADAPRAGTLSYQLRAIQPSDTPQGTARSRQVTTAVFLSKEEIDRASRIRVSGLRNERVSRR